MRFVEHPLVYPNLVEDREYQRRIASEARDKNTLVVLPTALGKTVIAALVAADVLYSFRDRRVLVMAPTRPLVVQHKRTFQNVLRLPEEDFSLLTGRVPSYVREGVWRGGSRLVFATPQVVRNDLLNKGLSLDGFGLLVFDEAHRAVKEYAYTEVASQYVKSSSYPLILATTASPGSDLDRVRMVCESLYIEHVEFRRDDDPDVAPYIQPVRVEERVVKLPLAYQPLKDIILGMLRERVNWLRERGYIKTDRVTRKSLVELGAELRYNLEMSIEEERGRIYQAIMQQSSALTLFHMLEVLETQGAYTLKAFLERLEEDRKRTHMTLVREDVYTHLLSLLEGRCFVEHPKVLELKSIVSNQLKTNPDSRILIFTQYRDTATHLVEELNRVEGVRAERFVGQATRLGDRGLTQEQQVNLLEDLRRGHINTLVATSVAEEGLDIPEVNLVVFYEPIPSEIRFIQRRGRTGRRTPGRVIILATQNTLDTTYLRASEKKLDKMRTITEQLNRILKPVLRAKQKPEPKPLTKEEILTLQKTAVRREPTQIQEEFLKTRMLEREVARAERTLYLKILQKGAAKIEDEELYEEMKIEGFSRSVVKAALAKLLKKKHLTEDEDKLTIPIKDIPGAKLMKITVEKILPNQAVVWIDDKWRARLLPENYNGPHQLIKRGSTFQALCELYKDSGTLHIKVRQVVKA
ncbi:MAG: DEAD/DEAH box helicase [Thaumarchaeota archaeon]|nr:DEAD/DEAH box helicase [Nitrososphaerota archaeon]